MVETAFIFLIFLIADIFSDIFNRENINGMSNARRLGEITFEFTLT